MKSVIFIQTGHRHWDYLFAMLLLFFVHNSDVYANYWGSKTLEVGGRIEENYEMFCKFWPKPIAKLINSFYTKSEESNVLS